MAKPGPKPKPTRLKILTGNPGQRPLPQNEPQPDAGLPQCPKRFDGDARKLWTTIGKQLAACGIMTKIDGKAFELLIDAYIEYMEASGHVHQTGPVWLEGMEGDGIPKFAYSPYWVQMNRAHKKLHTMLREFGMTPSARASVKSAVPLVGDTTDPAAKYFA